MGPPLHIEAMPSALQIASSTAIEITSLISHGPSARDWHAHPQGAGGKMPVSSTCHNARRVTPAQTIPQSQAARGLRWRAQCSSLLSRPVLVWHSARHATERVQLNRRSRCSAYATGVYEAHNAQVLLQQALHEHAAVLRSLQQSPA